MAIAATPSGAAARGLDWNIASFDVAIDVQTDGTLAITERIVADFSREPHHGIFRDIPYRYRRGGTSFEVRIAVEGVTDDSGRPHRYRTSRRRGKLRLKIGNPRHDVQAPTTYIIAYTVSRAINSFDSHDEVYWNVTGDQWPIPIDSATCTITLPEPATAETSRAASFTGPLGSANPGPPAVMTLEGAVRFEHTERLPAWNGFSVVVGFPKGQVAPVTTATHVGWFIRDNLIVVSPAVVFVLLWVLWRRRGRDLGEEGSITVQYKPPESLTPAEVGTLIDERVDQRDITAAIIDLAVRGYLRIDPEPNPDEAKTAYDGVHLLRLKKPPDDLKNFEREIIDGLFETRSYEAVAALENRFYKSLSRVRTQIYEELARLRLTDGKLNNVRVGWIVVGALLAVMTIGVGVLAAAGNLFAPVSTIIAVVLTAPLFPIFGYFMPRKTARGRKANEHIKGLEEYIERAELPLLETQSTQAHFEELLPFAMALGLSKEWGKRFEGLFTEPPQWYGGTMHQFTPYLFVAQLNTTSQSMTSSLASMPRMQSGGAGGGVSGFSGGGFSGGGFGGGGGGGW
ncbi:MAG: DUF2207 domain-containing protein [Phycisphaerae bacterium]